MDSTRPICVKRRGRTALVRAISASCFVRRCSNSASCPLPRRRSASASSVCGRSGSFSARSRHCEAAPARECRPRGRSTRLGGDQRDPEAHRLSRSGERAVTDDPSLAARRAPARGADGTARALANHAQRRHPPPLYPRGSRRLRPPRRRRRTNRPRPPDDPQPDPPRRPRRHPHHPRPMSRTPRPASARRTRPAAGADQRYALNVPRSSKAHSELPSSTTKAFGLGSERSQPNLPSGTASSRHGTQQPIGTRSP
jgi:hypothetical protein